MLADQRGGLLGDGRPIADAPAAEEDLPAALGAYKEGLAQAKLPVSMERNLLTTLAQLRLVTEDFAAAEDYAQHCEDED